MIHDIHAENSAGELRRVLAVIAARSEQAEEISAQFAKQGELVETIWFPDSRQLLAEKGTPRFEAVILFTSEDEVATDADESVLRDALIGTPLYRVG